MDSSPKSNIFDYESVNNRFQYDNFNEMNNTTSYNCNTSSPKNYDNKFYDIIEPKIINTLRSIKTNQSISVDEIKNLPGLFLEMQEALKKSNTNVLELKETINELIQKDIKSKNRLKEKERDNDNLKKQVEKYLTLENEYKSRLEKLKIDNINLNSNLNYANEYQKKMEELLKENKNLRRKDDENIRKIEKINEDIETKDRIITEQDETISNLKKSISELELKTKKYKTTQGFLKNEINNIEEKLDEIKNFKQEIKELQNETMELRTKVKGLEEERKSYLEKEQKLKEELKNFSSNNKKIKTELKNELNEKISILKELENLKSTQKIVHEKHENLKNTIEKSTEESNKISTRLKQIMIEKEELEKKMKTYNKDIQEKDHIINEIKCKYQEMYNDYNTLLKENNDLREDFNKKKFSEQEYFQLSNRYEEEVFNLKSEVNLWKHSFLQIAKYKLFNYDDRNSDDFLAIDRNYIYNSPSALREKIEGYITYFKSLIEEENFQTEKLKNLKDALVSEQAKTHTLKSQLMNELQLRRRIHNRYMLLRGNLRVMCRVRPFLDKENTSLIKKSYLDTFKINNEIIFISDNNKEKKFDFDYVFNQKSAQHEVYDEVSLLVQSMLKGNNICIIAYGQTCTGKTFTIQGPDTINPGIAVRAAKELFDIMEEGEKTNLEGKTKKKNPSKLSLSIIEIYNENIYNLLGENQPLLNIYENNNNNNLIIPDLNPIKINNFNEAAKLFKLASKLRHTSHTNYNDRSSRSHCIYSFHLKLMEDDNITRSKLHIIDLAGSERLSKTHDVIDEGLKREAVSINLSLNALSNVLNAIALKQNHVPYRDSKLTHFLKESLNENFNILLLLHISPNTRDLGETISSLEFGTRIVKICKHKTGKEKFNMNK